jgi:hypothetical protein
MIRTLVVALVLALALAVGGVGVESALTSSAGRSCPVTLPNQTVPSGAGFNPGGFNYGNAQLRAHLYWSRGTRSAGIRPGGGATAIINRDGSISVKLGWWRGLAERLVIRGRRLDASAPPLRVHIPDGYGPLGFQPTGLTFPTVGCWQVVGKLGRAG